MKGGFVCLDLMHVAGIYNTLHLKYEVRNTSKNVAASGKTYLIALTILIDTGPDRINVLTRLPHLFA